MTNVQSYEYDGTNHIPKPVLKRDGRTLVKNKDYVITCEGRTDAGIGLVKVTGIGNYTGTGKINFAVDPVDIGDSKKIKNNSEFDAKTLKLKGIDLKFLKNGRSLKNGKDFVVEYGSKNTEKNGRIVIKGIGNFSGKITYDYQKDGEFYNVMLS